METGILLFDLFLIIVAAKLAGELAERLGQPPVIGELLAGVLLGPGLLGWVEPGPGIELVAQLGIIILLLEVGLDTRLREFKGIGLTAFLVAAVGVTLPFLFGFGYSRLVGLPGGSGTAVFIGAVLAATSVGITVRTFSDLKLRRSVEARIVLGAAVIDDVIGLLLLSVVVSLADGDGFSLLTVSGKAGAAVLFLAAIVIAGHYGADHLLTAVEGRSRVRGTAFAVVLAVTFLASFLAEKIGLSAIIGAFAVGMALSESRQRQSLNRKLSSYAEVLTGVFFVSVGMKMDAAALAQPRVLLLATALTILAALGKVLAGLPARGKASPLLVGLGMVPRGEVGLIFAGVGLAAGILDKGSYAAILAMVFATTLMTPPLLKWAGRRAKPTGDDDGGSSLSTI